MKLYNTALDLHEFKASATEEEYPALFRYNAKNIEDLKTSLKLILSNVSKAHSYGGPFHVRYMSNREEDQSKNAFETGLTNIELDSVTYWINELGFRDEINKEFVNPKTATFGCSFTFGSGVPFEQTYTKRLQNTLDRKIHNFGIPGSGIQKIARTFSLINNFYKLDTAVFVLPTLYRSEIIHERQSQDIIPADMQNVRKPLDENNKEDAFRMFDLIGEYFYKIYDDDALALEYIRNLELIKSNAQINGTKIYLFTWCNYTHRILREKGNTDIISHISFAPEKYFARDGMHPSVNTHHLFYESILPYLGTTKVI